MQNTQIQADRVSELAVSRIRQVCAEHAKEPLSFLEENLSADRVNKGILRRILKKILLDDRLIPWFEQMELAIVERVIPSRLHLSPYTDRHSACRKMRVAQRSEKLPLFMTWLVSDLSIADSDIFLDPMEFLFEEDKGELVSAEDISKYSFPSSWTRRDALILPYRAVLDLLNWEQGDSTTAFTAWEHCEKHLLYPFRAYSPRFDDHTYGAFSLVWLMHIGDQLRFNESLGIKTRSILLVPVHIGPQSVGSFCFTSERRTSFADRAGLAQMAAEVTNWYLDAETELLERRRQTATVTVPTSLTFTHEARHILSTLEGSLRALTRELLAKSCDKSIPADMAKAEAQHTQLADVINKFERDLRYPAGPEVLSTRHLASGLSELFEKSGYKDIAVVGRACDTIFLLKGTVADLFQLIEPLVRNGLAAFQKQQPERLPSDLSELFVSDLDAHGYDFWVDPYGLDKSTKVLIGVAVPFSLKSTARLVIRIRDAGIGMSGQLVRALAQASTFARLPSDRLDGGRGMLSVITSIKARYKAQCSYDSAENAWTITLPATLAVNETQAEHERGPA